MCGQVACWLTHHPFLSATLHPTLGARGWRGEATRGLNLGSHLVSSLWPSPLDGVWEPGGLSHDSLSLSFLLCIVGL